MDEEYAANGSGHPANADVLRALERMLASQALRLSERNKRFLSFVVKQAVEGHPERIKAYAIGVDVFGRDEDFDPAVDPIVRIEANRLRTALSAYYDGPGRADGIVIAVPKGSYVPTFLSRPVSDSIPTSLPHELSNDAKIGATIVIHDRFRSTDPETELRGEIFAEALVIALRPARFKIRLFPKREHSAAAQAIDALFAEPENAYSLDVAVRPLGEKRRFSWRLIDLRTGEILASEVREFSVAAIPCFELIDAFASEAATTITSILAQYPASKLKPLQA